MVTQDGQLHSWHSLLSTTASVKDSQFFIWALSTKQESLRKVGIVHCGVFLKSWLGALSFSSKEFILHMMSKVESN